MTGDEPGRTQLRNKFSLSGHGLTEEELDDLMEEFIDDCKKQSDVALKVVLDFLKLILLSVVVKYSLLEINGTQFKIIAEIYDFSVVPYIF